MSASTGIFYMSISFNEHAHAHAHTQALTYARALSNGAKVLIDALISQSYIHTQAHSHANPRTCTSTRKHTFAYLKQTTILKGVKCVGTFS